MVRDSFAEQVALHGALGGDGRIWMDEGPVKQILSFLLN